MSMMRTHHRFSVADYDQMIELGILTENDRVELIRGEIIDKMSIGDLHAACVRVLTRLLTLRLGDRASVSVQNPVRLGASVPEPDAALLKWRDDQYAGAHPTASDVLLLIEVADTSLEFDRTVKAEIYAENGIRDYWIVNLIDRTLEVHRQPLATGQYAETRVLQQSDATDLVMLPGVTFIVAELFPPATNA